MEQIKQKRTGKTVTVCMGGMFIALFALISNIPFLNNIQLIPGVPMTLQVFLVALMALLLGLRGGLMTLTALLLLIACGLPLLAGGAGGVQALAGMTCGYIYGWYPIVILLGAYRDHWMPRLVGKKKGRLSLHIPVAFLLGIAGTLLCYLCGTIGLMLVGGTPLSAFWTTLSSNLAFLPADAIKILGAAVFSMTIYLLPQYRKLANKG